MDNQTVVVPHIEDDVPIPKNAKEALPDLSTQEELEARTNTIKMLADIQDENIEPSKENMEEAEILAEEMMSNPELKPDFGNYPNETIAFLAGMVAQTSHMVAKDLADIKLTVLNGLLQEAYSAKSSRERITALKAVGEIDGVDAFKKKTEITHINQSGEELEKELMKTINELKGKVVRTTEIIDVEDVEVNDD